jgi:hypothetical protein
MVEISTAMTNAFSERQRILDQAGAKWRFLIAVQRFERALRNVEVHIQRHGAVPLPDSLWAEEQIARKELMAFSPSRKTDHR